MGADEEVTAAVTSAIRQLKMIDACRDVWTEADQSRYIRVLLEDWIDELARADEAQCDFMSECVFLACENMQDARLGILEERVDRAENPPGGGALGFLAQLGVMLALELLVISGATYGIPALVVLAGTRLRANRVRRIVAARTERQGLLSGAKKTLSDQLTASQALADMDKLILVRARELEDSVLDPELPTTWISRTRALRNHRRAVDERALVLAAYERSEAAAKAAADVAQNAYAQPLTVLPSMSSGLASAQLASFLDGALGSATVGRVAENSATVGTEKILAALAGAGDTATTGLFQTTTLLGRFLNEIRGERNRTAAEWSALRRHVRFLSDADLLASEFAHDLFLEMHLDPAPAATQDVVFADRQFLVLGFEAALWLAWFRHVQALGTATVRGRIVGPGARVGEIRGDLLITGLPEGMYDVADGTAYAALQKLSDPQAEYLYKRFARSFFVRSPARAPKFANLFTKGAVAFSPVRYDEVSSMPPTDPLGWANRDRQERVAEMKVLAAIFFDALQTDPAIGGPDDVADTARTMLRDMFGVASAPEIVGAFLAASPPVSEPDPVADAISQPAQSVLVSPEQERAARDAVLKLADLVTDLELLITRYLQESPDDTLAGRAAALAQRDLIDMQKEAVRMQRDAGRKLAADLPDVLADIDSYTARIDALMVLPEDTFQFESESTPTPSLRRRHGTHR